MATATPPLPPGLDKNAAELLLNAITFRQDFTNKLLDTGSRDIDLECGYPENITIAAYRQMYDRNGIAQRFVQMYPQACWEHDPLVYENEESDSTEFEDALGVLITKYNLWHYLERIDELSRIGTFGIMLLGINDNQPLSTPVEQVTDDGEFSGPTRHELTYIRVFDESLVSVKEYEQDETSPRYMKPLLYKIKFVSPDSNNSSSVTSKVVHWSRCVHIAANRKSSECFGDPELRSIWNYLLNIRKVLGGSAEMFWKGGFPGYAFEVDPEVEEAPDAEGIREEWQEWANSLRRALIVQGVTVKSLAPQVSDPKSHLNVNIEACCASKAIPKRIYLGSEAAQLASEQDDSHWNGQVAKVQTKYTGPMIIRPVINRLVELGILPQPETLFVEFVDLSTPSDKDKAEVFVLFVEAFSKYIGGNVDALIPPLEFLTMFAGLSQDQATAILEAARSQIRERGLESSPPPEEDFDESEI